MNFIINDNKKNTDLIIEHILLLANTINNQLDQININVFNDIQLNNQLINYPNGDKYEGDWRNGNKEGKGIYYFNNGNRYEGDYRNDNKEGKGVFYYNSGDRYEGDWRNGKRDGKGIYYYNNGDRMMGDYLNGKPIGKHAMLTKNGEVKTNYY